MTLNGTQAQNISTYSLTENPQFFSGGSHAERLKKEVLKSYHLGNVHLVLSDRKQTSTYDNTISAYEYYPFGMAMQTYETDAYRYGFNGQEKDDEVYGEGNSTSALFWQYDARLGRRWNLDPKLNESISQYSCFANSPLMYADPLGDTLRFSGDKRSQRKFYRAVNYLSKHSETFREAITELENSPKLFVVQSSIYMFNKLPKKVKERFKAEKDVFKAERKRLNKEGTALENSNHTAKGFKFAVDWNPATVSNDIVDDKIEGKGTGGVMYFNFYYYTHKNYKTKGILNPKNTYLHMLTHEFSHFLDHERGTNHTEDFIDQGNGRQKVVEMKAINFQNTVMDEVSKSTNKDYGQRVKDHNSTKIINKEGIQLKK